jgi:hypothetical protein
MKTNCTAHIPVEYRQLAGCSRDEMEVLNNYIDEVEAKPFSLLEKMWLQVNKAIGGDYGQSLR